MRLRLWGSVVTCAVKMMSLCHGWGWQPPQTASPIHIRHIKIVWAHWYAVHCRYMVAALHSYAHPAWLRFLGTGSLVQLVWCHYLTALYSYPYPPNLVQILGFWFTCEWEELKWCHDVMVEADIHLKLLPPSILLIHKVFEHIDMLSLIGIH